MPYVGSYVWKLRQKVGQQLLLLPVALVIVEREDGHILLMKRADNHLWATIGGLAEPGNGFEATALAEVKEEAGIIGDRADLIPFASFSSPQTHAFTYPSGDDVQLFGLGFVLRKWRQSKDSIDKSEVLKLQFFSPDNPPAEMSAPTFAELEAYRKFLATNTFQLY